MIIDETDMLGRLMAAQAQMREAVSVIDAIANKVHPRAVAYSSIEVERLRQQTRANELAIEVERLSAIRASPASVTAAVRWVDARGAPGILTGHAVRIGSRVVAWTNSGAGDDNHAIIHTDDADLARIARDHAEGIASYFGELS